MRGSYYSTHERQYGLIGQSLRAFQFDGESVEDSFVRLLARLRAAVGPERFHSLIAESETFQEQDKDEEGLRTSKVKFFVNGDSNYGFTEDSIFFHLDRGIQVGCTGGNEPTVIVQSPKQAPKKGDILVLQAVQARRGLAAKWWTFQSEWDAAKAEIEKRPTIRLYDRGLDRTLWQGQDLDKLRFMYPKERMDPRLWSPSRFVFEQYGQEKAWLGQESIYVDDWFKVEDPR